MNQSPIPKKYQLSTEQTIARDNIKRQLAAQGRFLQNGNRAAAQSCSVIIELQRKGLKCTLK